MLWITYKQYVIKVGMLYTEKNISVEPNIYINDFVFILSLEIPFMFSIFLKNNSSMNVPKAQM